LRILPLTFLEISEPFDDRLAVVDQHVGHGHAGALRHAHSSGRAGDECD